MSSKLPISVVVVDDHPLFRRGVVELLNESDDMQVIAEYENAFELIDNLDRTYPDLLLLDLQMPDKSGLELLQLIRERDNHLKIIMITACTEQEKLLEALRYGANGYLQKDTPSDEIVSHILAVVDGKVALNNDAIESLANHIRQSHVEDTEHSNALIADLTEREMETLSFIAKGLNNKLIARELGISDGTVKVYVKNLLRKLNMHSRLELSAWAHKNLPEEQLS
jgi:two-component system nitrate/nitrite response regulator NarL